MIRPSKEQLMAWHEDPAKWRWGIIYCHPEDKRLLPPKRIRALGWAINFANPRSILLVVAILVLLICLVRLIARYLPS